MEWIKIKTLGELKKHSYTPKTIKEELRHNLVEALKRKKGCF
jgi:magnesium chelatase subunit I